MDYSLWYIVGKTIFHPWDSILIIIFIKRISTRTNDLRSWSNIKTKEKKKIHQDIRYEKIKKHSGVHSIILIIFIKL